MKNRLFILLFLVIAFYGCDEINKLTQFEIDYDEDVVIPSATGIDIPFNISTPDISTNSESEFSVNDTRKDLIQSIYLQSMTLTVTQPGDGDFGFLKSIALYIRADGLDEVKVAWQDEVPENVGQTLELETSDVDLQEYVKKESFSMKATTVTDELITSDHHINILSVFLVDAKILGI
jgi:hypothetical protein